MGGQIILVSVLGGVVLIGALFAFIAMKNKLCSVAKAGQELALQSCSGDMTFGFILPSHSKVDPHIESSRSVIRKRFDNDRDWWLGVGSRLVGNRQGSCKSVRSFGTLWQQGLRVGCVGES